MHVFVALTGIKKLSWIGLIGGFVKSTKIVSGLPVYFTNHPNSQQSGKGKPSFFCERDVFSDALKIKYMPIFSKISHRTPDEFWFS